MTAPFRVHKLNISLIQSVCILIFSLLITVNCAVNVCENVHVRDYRKIAHKGILAVGLVTVVKQNIPSSRTGNEQGGKDIF